SKISHRLLQHAQRRLAAVAPVLWTVRAPIDAVQFHPRGSQQRAQPVMNRSQSRRIKQTPRDSRLIRHHDQPQPLLRQTLQTRGYSRQQFHLIWIVQVVPLRIERSVPIEKHIPPTRQNALGGGCPRDRSLLSLRAILHRVSP